MARVQVSDETWSAFRAGLGPVPASVALGRLVEREVGGWRRRSAADAGGVHEALQDARAVVAELSEMIARLEIAQGREPSRVAGRGSYLRFEQP
jgi:hypothetical protein